MATSVETSTHIIDSAIGPVAVKVDTVNNYDIDDFVHSTVRSQGLHMRFVYLVSRADPKLAKNRPPINLDDLTLGGY